MPGDVEGAGADVALLAAAVQQRRAARRPGASSSAPTPIGPPSLCPVTVSASTPLAAKSTGTCPTACTASVCNGTPCRARDRGQLGDRLDRADLVVGPHHADHRDRRRVVGRAPRRSASGCDPAGRRRPAASVDLGALVLGQPVDRVEHGVVLDRADHDPAAARVGRPAGPRRCP